MMRPIGTTQSIPARALDWDIEVVLDVILQIINVVNAILRLFGLDNLGSFLGGGG